MKKYQILIALMIVSNVMIAQNRGGRGGNSRGNEVVLVQMNNAPLSNISTNVYSNLDNNVGNMNYSNVQISNVNFNNNIQQQAIIPNTRNVNVTQSRNANPVAIEVPQQLASNRNKIPVNNDESQVVEQEQIMPEPVQQMAKDNVDNEVSLNVDPSINMPEINADINLSLQVDNAEPVQQKQVADRESAVKINEKSEKVESEPLSIEMPNISLNLSKKTNTVSVKKHKKYKGFSYSQHVSLMERISSKTTAIKQLFKKKNHKKVVCSVVCYQF